MRNDERGVAADDHAPGAAGNGGARNPSGLAAIVLAAGRSTRMKSKTPKALHPVCGRPLLAHLLDALLGAGVTRPVVVVGHQADQVRAALDALYGAGRIEYALQAEQKGTGHAARMAEPLLADHRGAVLVVPGDTPLLTAGILRDLVAAHNAPGSAATLLTAVLPHDAGAYGRILRTGDGGEVAGIVEARDATPEQRAIREISTSVYAFSGPALFRALRDLRPDNAQGELYLTDVIGLLRAAGEKVGALVSPDPDIVLGVNNRVELAAVAEKMRHRLLETLMLGGVSVIDPATTFVEAGVRVGMDTVLLPFTTLAGDTTIGEDAVIGPHAHVRDSVLGDRVTVRACFIERSEIGDDCRVGPFANLRPGTRLGRGVKIGDFVETKNAVLHDDVSAGHLAYLGDAEIGAHTNIGAGTITCNYDGVRKHRTLIGGDAFIGSHTTLVAPVAVDHGAMTAAGSVITDNVPAGALAVARERQTNKEGWAARRRGGGDTAAAAPPGTQPAALPVAGEGTDR
jgi:bifunctional UDP-N-acetylglucosamine pyrophosphorylase/glucosamine-1-phosphate N-acetyltransferase